MKPSTDNPQLPLVWEAESTHPGLVEPFRQAMREIMDPEIGMNILQLGLVRDLKIKDDSAVINMILTTPFCPYGPAMLEVTRQKAEAALGRPTTIELGLEMWDFSMMEEDARADWGFY